ncbi:MAG: SDR family NAD(P)-dependent oxidoreductase, partial [Pseudomonadota bacterium]|nr:SDR family NAD(P)-dependent oxidoreductase [Pseudomonadota bacterium]
MSQPHTMIVTGASRGIGAATATLAGRRGWRVCVNYSASPEKAAEVVAAIEAADGEAFSHRANMGLEAGILELYRAVDERWGQPDAVVNNAGIDHESTIADAEWDNYLKVFNVNILGLMLSCREAVRRMSTSRGG